MDNLRNLRKSRNLLQKDLAQTLGVAVSTYSGWENGATEIDNKNIIRLADYFNTSVDFLLDRVNQNFFTSALIPKTEIQALFDSLNPLQQQSVLGYIKGLKSYEPRKYS